MNEKQGRDRDSEKVLPSFNTLNTDDVDIDFHTY